MAIFLEILGALGLLTLFAGCVISIMKLSENNNTGSVTDPLTGEVTDTGRAITDEELTELARYTNLYTAIVRQRAIELDIDLDAIAPDNLITFHQYAQLVETVEEYLKDLIERQEEYSRIKKCRQIRENIAEYDNVD